MRSSLVRSALEYGMTDASPVASTVAPPLARVNENASPTPEKPDAVPATLRHIAIIPDGNRRWAAARGLPLWDGVRTGVKTAEAVFEAVRQRGIPWCTFWASSYDNLVKRPRTERTVLNELFAGWFSRLAENTTVHREQVRVRVLGEWPDLLADAAVRAIERVQSVTANYRGPSLTFLVGYDGDRELVAAVRELLQQGTGGREPHSAEAPRGRQATGDLTIGDLRKHSWTKDLPEVDLLIRTGSWEDPHRSANFLSLLTSNVQESYPRLHWPDFSEDELQRVIDDFAARGRRLGA